MERNDSPLVSVAMITYNSAQFVLDTLESIKRQDYKNIELIIADDCSKDNTIALCENWLRMNKDRFVQSGIITVEKNTGIPANCNRAVKASHGSWLKIIAGDDILDDHCISLNIDFCRSRDFADMIVISNMIEFKDGTDHRTGKLVTPPDLHLLKGNVDPAVQQEYLLRSHFGNSPSLFVSKNILNRIPYDESIPFMEDWPFAINAAKAGYFFQYLDQVTVYYRISNSSVFASKSKNVLFNDFYKKRRPFLFKYIYPSISHMERLAMDIDYHRLRMLDKMGLNRNNLFCRLISIITLRLTPFYYFHLFRKRF